MALKALAHKEPLGAAAPISVAKAWKLSVDSTASAEKM